MYATNENRVWTAKDEREQQADHKRATRATMKHLGKLPTEQDRSMMDKLLRRQTPAADLPLNRRPLPPKTPTSDSHWWSRSSGRSTPRTPTHESHTHEPRTPGHEHRPEIHRAATLTGNTRPLPPPVPPMPPLPPMPRVPSSRPEPVKTPPPHRPRLKSEQGFDARRRARETALRHLEVDRGFGRYVRENPGYVAPPLQPGTWLPGQLNVVPHADVRRDDYPYDLVDKYEGPTTPELLASFPLPPGTTQPLNVTPRRRDRDAHNIPIPPVPPMPERSNRDSFLELRRKRSCRV
ncbi:hypothetical protein FRC12_012624 [Ceratobasidium sp. 428]|nr:hypothetical protein FRC12_012624 [Ceratobasidium sp. 428]